MLFILIPSLYILYERTTINFETNSNKNRQFSVLSHKHDAIRRIKFAKVAVLLQVSPSIRLLQQIWVDKLKLKFFKHQSFGNLYINNILKKKIQQEKFLFSKSL